MYIHHRPVAALYKLFIALVATGIGWYLFSVFGWAALRLFPVWVLFITAVYYSLSALILALNRKAMGKNPAPMFEGMIIMSFVLMVGMTIASFQHHFYLPELASWLMVFLCVLMPIFVFLDWALFVKKGRWKPMAPFYWLALPACYAAAMIFSAHFMQDSEPLHYPLEIFNYFEIGVLDMLGWILVIAILDLCVGYILFLLDFALSGKLAQKIVLPHVQVVEIDEHGKEVKTQLIEKEKISSNEIKESKREESSEALIKDSKEAVEKKESEKKSSQGPKNNKPASKAKNEGKSERVDSIKVEIKAKGNKIKKPVSQKEQLKKTQEKASDNSQRTRSVNKKHKN